MIEHCHLVFMWHWCWFQVISVFSWHWCWFQVMRYKLGGGIQPHLDTRVSRSWIIITIGITHSPESLRWLQMISTKQVKLRRSWSKVGEIGGWFVLLIMIFLPDKYKSHSRANLWNKVGWVKTTLVSKSRGSATCCGFSPLWSPTLTAALFAETLSSIPDWQTDVISTAAKHWSNTPLLKLNQWISVLICVWCRRFGEFCALETSVSCRFEPRCELVRLPFCLFHRRIKSDNYTFLCVCQQLRKFTASRAQYLVK